MSSIASIDTEVAQIQSDLDNLKLTKVQNSVQEVKQDDPNRLKEELDKLTETNIAQVKTKISELDKQRVTAEEEKKSLKNIDNTFEIIAPEAGVINLNSEVDTTLPKYLKEQN